MVDLPEHPTVVGIHDIARRLGVSRATVDQWKWRGLLPEPRWMVSHRPAWDWADIERWAKETGRLHVGANGDGEPPDN